MHIPTNYGRPLMLVANALDDHDTISRPNNREYGCLRGHQPSPADRCCPFGMDCNSVRPRLAHVIMDGWRTIRKSFRCDMARARLRLIDEEITSPVHNPGTRHSVGNARIVNRSRGSKRSELSACPQRVTCGNDAFVTRLYELLTDSGSQKVQHRFGGFKHYNQPTTLTKMVHIKNSSDLERAPGARSNADEFFV